MLLGTTYFTGGPDEKSFIIPGDFDDRGLACGLRFGG